MDYSKHYDRLITRAKSRLLEGYVEKHHVVPKCLGGTNDISNLVVLTPEEHYVAHQLLVKMYPENQKLIFAAHMMTVNHYYGGRKNKLYGWIKKKLRNTPRVRKIRKKETRPRNRDYTMSEEQKKKISFSLKGHVHSEETKEKIRQSNIKTKRSKRRL